MRVEGGGPKKGGKGEEEIGDASVEEAPKKYGTAGSE